MYVYVCIYTNLPHYFHPPF
ncbi:unnamed protein product [Spirodela intermedia]|uniref:Uncharacterized protein n=1 Tax=Spirodela intermedia TaxID=51605 RepID=A0A7I8JFU1_SPIIN|nr:unnamed protein product [Spirodela intermedia]CAA6669014.1 unnamed protein product [Spirodela intermedia]